MSTASAGGNGPRGERGFGLGASRPGTRNRRRKGLGAWILAAFLLVPLVELAIAIQVGRWIGVVPTILLLLVESMLGAWIVRREGASAWRALVAALESGRLPGRELSDAVLVLLGGALLLTPGFLTDVVGFAFVIPATRPPARKVLAAVVRRYAGRRFVGARPGGPPGVVITGQVIDGVIDEVVDDPQSGSARRTDPGGSIGRAEP